MHRSLLEVLCCPRCHGPLEMVEGRGAAEIEAGVLECAECGRRFEVEEGMPVLGTGSTWRR